MPINSRQKGNDFERWFCNYLKELGYTATRASYTNKFLDDNGKVDIETDFPINFQLKATEKCPLVHKILQEMDKTKPRAILWKRNSLRHNPKPKLVIMELDEFIELIDHSKLLMKKILNNSENV